MIDIDETGSKGTRPIGLIFHQFQKPLWSDRFHDVLSVCSRKSLQSVDVEPTILHEHWLLHSQKCLSCLVDGHVSHICVLDLHEWWILQINGLDAWLHPDERRQPLPRLILCLLIMTHPRHSW